MISLVPTDLPLACRNESFAIPQNETHCQGDSNPKSITCSPHQRRLALQMRPAVAIVTFAAIVASTATAYEGHVERELILSGEVVPSGTKTFVAGLRLHRDSDSLCGGFLITPTHVLTASHCTANQASEKIISIP
ncbi:hypothetical protein V7S43_010236 [Phytophthora oleae]|uniref:Peptidase S1 domain-containing protein n=1 Tax=Phytophthora oleae TaxID=2107226 RepID=A0ABD3FDI0_9STRA